MKNHRNLVAGILLASIFVSSLRAISADSANIVVNGDMETWIPATPHTGPRPAVILPEGTVPEGYDCDVEVIIPDQPVEVTISRDRLIKHGGDFSVKIESSQPEQTGNVTLREVPIERSTQYKVRVWIRGDDIYAAEDRSFGAVVWLQYGPNEDFWTNPSSKRELQIPEIREGGFEWTLFEFTFDSLPDSDLLRVNLQLRRASGKVWFDDLEVIPVGKSQPAPKP